VHGARRANGDNAPGSAVVRRPPPGFEHAMSPPDDDERTVVRPASGRSGVAAGQLGHHLPLGTRIRDYEITGLIGEGGFGIVYLAQDVNLERRVAVKEYMPSSMASRVGNSHDIVVKSERHRETFAAGLKSFINEARLLARFDHPALLKVYRFWEENGTAYMAMPFYEGPTLKGALAARADPPDEAALRAWLRPLLDALSVMHAAQCFHRDIAPDNILLTSTGPLLLDFGAARRVIGDMTHALTVVLKPGYAPIEQYGDVASMTQGAWTDLYALACVVYFAITGKVPMSSVERLMDDRLQPLSQVAAGRYSPRFLEAIDRALAVRPQDRPQTDAEFRAMFEDVVPAYAPVHQHPPTVDDEATRIIPHPRTQVPTRHGQTIAPTVGAPSVTPGPQTTQPTPQTMWPPTAQPPGPVTRQPTLQPPAAPPGGGRTVGPGGLDTRPGAPDTGHGALDTGSGAWPGTQSGYHSGYPQTGYPPLPQTAPGAQPQAGAWPGTTTGFPATSYPQPAQGGDAPTYFPPAPATAPPPATVHEARPATVPSARPTSTDVARAPSRLPLIAGVAVGAIALAVAAYVWTGRSGTTTPDVTSAPAPQPGPASAVVQPPTAAPVPAPAPAPVAAPAPEPAPPPAPVAAPAAAPAPTPAPAPSPVAAPAPSPAPAPPPRERRERTPPVSENPHETAAPPVAKPGRSAAVQARCSDILQKASLEQLSAEESSFLRKECR
jgi:serine/threonine protein kinase